MKMAAAHVPDEMIESLDRIAELRQVERTKVIRWALAEYINRFFNCPSEMTNDIPEVQIPADITT